MPKREKGQTIIIAMIVLGVLLILGFVFIGLIGRNAHSSYDLGRRSMAADLAEGGIRYAHQEMLQSELGADWRGTPTSLGTGNSTLDPDAYYLRPPATLTDGTPLAVNPGGSQIDLGGPDGLGPYFRLPNSNGRSLVRVRYAPSDANIFSTSPVGALRHPGLARDYIIIESVGRPGLVNVNDPTTLSTSAPIQFRNFGADVDFRAALGQMKAAESLFATSQVQRAFVSIGIIESSHYVTNKYHVTRPVDLGIPAELGVQYNGVSVASALPLQLGNTEALYNLGLNPTPAGQIEGNGSAFINDSVVVHGTVVDNLNRYMGDQFDVAGSMKGDANAQLVVNLRDVQPLTGQWAPVATTILTEGSGSMDSLSPNFNTVSDTVRDGNFAFDLSGNPRSIGYKTPPSIEVTDQDTGENRYVSMAINSGVEAGNGNSGKYGHGGSVYINNPSDVQGAIDEQGRINSGSAESLVYDWLNPNNGQQYSAWQGYFYTPPGAVLKLLNDGFTIQRDTAGPAVEQTWQYANGVSAGSPFAQFRIGLGSDGQRHIVNSFTPVSIAAPTTPINITGPLAPTDYDKGPVFTGVVYFAGNVRVSGVIATDVQMTVVSNATIYIDNSITKGVTANGLQPTEGFAVGQLINRPTKSMLALLAKDYVCINTTQFFGTATSEPITPDNDTPGSNGFNPVRVGQNVTLALTSQFARDPLGPTANATNPSTWRPFEMDYAESGTPAVKIPTSLLLAHTMDDGPAAATFFALNVNQGGPAPAPYFFLRAGNTAGNYIAGVSPTLQVYGLGSEIYQRYPKFEQTTFTLIDPTTATMSGDGQQMIANGVTGNYSLFAEGQNEFDLTQVSVAGVATNDYILGRAALNPHDIKIEATMFAEEGSFFVIPGPWFNPNPNDRRDTYTAGTDVYATATTQAEKDAIRLDQFGSSQGMPFYGEPLDNRIVISGAVSENMPPPASVQAEWLKKWGWIPKDIGSTGFLIPTSHVPANMNVSNGTNLFVPNLIISYDQALATDRSNGFVTDNSPGTLIRVDSYGRPLPPLPRLPVSPSLAYFGEVH